jgi:ABC-type uncharacterized transport system auxiliary subunit
LRYAHRGVTLDTVSRNCLVVSRVACLLALAVALAGCNTKFKYAAKRDDGWYLKTDSSMTAHENPSNKSSTGVGIPGY